MSGELFFLDPEYTGFVPGKSRVKLITLGGSSAQYLGSMAGWGILPLILMIALFDLSSERSLLDPTRTVEANGTQPVAFLIIALLIFISILLFLHELYLFREALHVQHKLDVCGRLLDGTLNKSTRQIVPRSRSHPKQCRILLRYTFTAPDGRMITREIMGIRQDLMETPLPEAGTPVKVLYADDYAVILL